MIKVDFTTAIARIGEETDGWESDDKELEALLNSTENDPPTQHTTQDPLSDLVAYAIELFGGQIISEKQPRQAPDDQDALEKVY